MQISQQHNEGFQAYLDDKCRNPYNDTKQSQAWVDWNEGWNIAHMEYMHGGLEDGK